MVALSRFAMSDLARQKRVEVELDGNVVRIHTDQPAGIQPVIDALRRHDLIIHSVELIRQSLEDFFVETVADSHNSEGTGKGNQP